MQFPQFRARRTRSSAAIRRLVRETTLTTEDLLYPIFVSEGKGVKQAVDSMPGQYRYSIDQLSTVVETIRTLRIPGVLLFGTTTAKDGLARAAVAKDSLIARAVAEIKRRAPDLLIATDVCLCAYTDHGHCGIVQKNVIDNDATLEVLAEMALSHARAGANLIAPSDMMDGRVGVIRESLDEEEYSHVGILAYSAKYASAYYGPFRDAADCEPKGGERTAYQMDPANGREALVEVTLDVEEGADIVMVKPALAYLDIIARLRDEFDLPIAAYNVSGEYAMVKAAAQRGWIDEQRIIIENLTAIKRAGADIIITYHALEAAELIDR